MRRIHFFELFVLANLALVALLFHRSLPIVGSPLIHFATLLPTMFGCTLLGIVVRIAIGLARRDRSYLATLKDRGWLLETLRLIVAAALVVIVYGWIKLVVPVYHPRLFDQLLWDLDQLLLFGIEPATFMLQLFSAPSVLRAVDLSYGNIFFISIVVANSYFFSHPDRKLRVAFANGNALLWIAGAWLYLALPSLGPAFRFPEVWLAHGEGLRVTQGMQAILMRNYQNVLRAAANEPVTEPIRIVFGIGAFPSLHVAYQTYVFLWMRRLWTAAQVLFALFVLVIFFGSMITGWHYLIDGLIGFLMAYLAYRFCFPRHATDRGAIDAGSGAVETNR